MTEGNGRSGDQGEPVAIIGAACRFPGARDPAEFHELAVTRRRMFQPVRALPGRPLRAATLDDWAAPPVTEGNWLCDDSAGVHGDVGHGTGTVAGDSAELAAFSRLRRDTRVTAALGTASASIGYTRAAAGIASLIRTAAAMAAGQPDRAADAASRTACPAAAAIPAGPPAAAADSYGSMRL